jgi:hypothetical protein
MIRNSPAIKTIAMSRPRGRTVMDRRIGVMAQVNGKWDNGGYGCVASGPTRGTRQSASMWRTARAHRRRRVRSDAIDLALG